MNRRSIAVFLVFVLALCCSAFAQTFRGSIQGTITDASGAAVVGAHIKVVNPATGFVRAVVSNEQGEYSASELPLGSYSVTVEKEGFRAVTLTKVPVSVGSPARADAHLSTGEVKEVVEVSADVPMVETASNTTGGTIDAAQASELPINGRDFTKILELVPGTTSDPNGSTESAGSYGLFTLNGNRGRSNNYLLDGTDMNDGYRNLPAINQAGVWGCPSTILPVDALAEIPVTGSPEAEFGRSSGATVNIVTKSGSNQIHGSTFENYRNDSLGARNFFNTANQQKNSFHNHQFGASAGGPIIKDKSFWFVAYEGQRENGSLPQLGTVPTQADIATATASIGGSVNQVVANLLARNPWGTLPASGSGSVTFATPFTNNSDNLIVKLDQHLHLFSQGDLLTGRYFYSHGKQSFPLGMLNTGASAPGFNTTTPTHVNIISLSYTTVPKNDLIIEIRGGYNRFLQQFLPNDIKFDPTSIGLDTLPPGASASRDWGLPVISVSGDNGSYSTIGSGSSVSRGRIDTNYQLFGNVSLTKGKHNYKAGAEWRRTFINSFINSGHRGSLSFASLEDFLSGTIDGGSSAEGASTRYSYQNGGGAYFQDSWRFTNHITLNYGVRWDYFGVVGEKNNQFSLFNPTTDALDQVGAKGGPKALYPHDWNNFAPRVSAVDDLFGNGKLVLRSGVGIFYDGPSQDFFVGNQPWNTLPAEAGPAFNNIGFAGTVASNIVSGQSIYGDYASSSAFTVSKKLSTPYYVSYNVNLESQLAHHVAAQIGYVGSQGRHLFHFRDINQYNNVANRVVDCGNGTTLGYNTQTGCFPNFVYINQIETSSISNYNSLQASLKVQNWHGLTSTLNYTWAHSIDTASDGLDFVPNAAQPDDSFNPHGERASSNFDARQRVQWYFNYAVPNVKTAKWITNGWGLNGSFNFQSGQPFTVSYLYEGDFNGSNEWFGRPDVVGNPKAKHKVNAVSGGYDLLNSAAFVAPCTWDNTAGSCVSGTQHPGSEGRNAFTSTSFVNFDFTIAKNTKLTEKVAMELRADIFNLLNHPNFGNPLLPSFSLDAFSSSNFVQTGTLATPAARQQTASLHHSPMVRRAARPADGGDAIGKVYAGSDANSTIQTVATPDVASGNPYLGGGGPRTAQLSVRFSF